MLLRASKHTMTQFSGCRNMFDRRRRLQRECNLTTQFRAPQQVDRAGAMLVRANDRLKLSKIFVRPPNSYILQSRLLEIT